MAAVTLYHNPRCSKSRRALELLRERGIEPRIIEYLSSPPSAPELARILRLLGRGARALIRPREAEYQACGLDDPTLTEEALIQAMVEHPVLIERPIVVAGEKAALGRPPESVLEIV